MTSLVWSDEFHKRLGEAIAWCSRRPVASDPAYSLRSPSLRPNVVTAQAYAQALPDVAQFDRSERNPEQSIPEWRRWGWSWSSQANELSWITLVDELREERLKQLRAERIDASCFADSLAKVIWYCTVLEKTCAMAQRACILRASLTATTYQHGIRGSATRQSSIAIYRNGVRGVSMRRARS
jgi:hypothetical protein